MTGVLRQTGLVAFLLVGGLLPLRPVEAGSVFMKNGYIIQAPIVEHSDLSVVLGWPNGKVTIFRRFVEKVDFEPGEERKTAAPADLRPANDEEIISAPVEEELPTDLADLIKAHNLPLTLVGSQAPPPGESPDGGQGADSPGTHPVVDVTPVPPPSGRGAPRSRDGLAERSSQRGFSIRPPQGWQLGEQEGCVAWRGRAAGSFSPSLNVISIPRRNLPFDAACRLLKESQKAPLQGYQPSAEGPLQVGSLRAYQVEGRGLAEGDRPVRVRQLILEKGERLWLLSSFQEAGGDEVLEPVLTASLQSFQTEG